MDQTYWKEDLGEEEAKKKSLLPEPPPLVLLDKNGSNPVSFVFWCLHQSDKNSEVRNHFLCIWTFWEILFMHYFENTRHTFWTQQLTSSEAESKEKNMQILQ